MIEKLVRPNVLSLKPYSSARDDFSGEASVFLDANENPYNEPYNRYPDPLASKLKLRIAVLKSLKPEQIFTGNGSDEAIDLLIRIFCEPATDQILSVDPTYGMYKVCADINGVPFTKIKLLPDFQPDLDRILKLSNAKTKLLFLCSPNNPTGNSFSESGMLVLIKNFPGIVIIDEAYIDFSKNESFLRYLDQFHNLVILQTLSKAWGLAGLRLGMAFANPSIITLMNKVKFPYNINIVTQKLALEKLQNVEKKDHWIELILAGRDYLATELMKFPMVQKVFPSDSNFLLVKVLAPVKLYSFLINQGIIVRDRSSVSLCDGCLRITAGTPKENNALLDCLKKFIP
jgi:histidinol-phosphate aminotransferase